MNQTVTVKAKKDFIQWILETYQMKQAECEDMLSYYLSHEELLENLHFVEEAYHAPRAIIMTTTDSNGIPFRFYNGKTMTNNATETFVNIKKGYNEKMYVQLNCSQEGKVELLYVLEENPFLIEETNEEDSLIVEQLIEHVMKASQQNYFNRMIDEALDNGDKELFMQLTSHLFRKGVIL